MREIVFALIIFIPIKLYNLSEFFYYNKAKTINNDVNMHFIG